MTAPAGAGPTIGNFSGDVRFRPTFYYTPRSEDEVVAILDRHADGTVRVVGARHSWNDGIVSDDVLVDLRHLDHVKTTSASDGTVWATVGGGCRLKTLLDRLRHKANATLPTMGLITEQSIAGVISTGTHGSGRHSISHYMEEIRVAAYDPETGKATIHTLTEGEALRAGRCAVGCMGVVLSVTFRCPPRYLIAESLVQLSDIDEVLRREAEFPLQQFYLIPHLWRWYNQQRRVDDRVPQRPSVLAPLYRLYWLGLLDVGFHLLLKLLTAKPMGTAPVRFFYRRVFPLFVVQTRPVSDWCERQLVMEHELFEHMEIELFVPRHRVRDAATFTREVLGVFAGTAAISESMRQTLEPYGLLPALEANAGSFTHHYPICFRRVLTDDTLLSMASGGDEPWYAISFITYQRPRAPFIGLATFLAQSMAALFGARPHWGKFVPVLDGMADQLYPEATIFREVCRRVDPRGVFRNSFVKTFIGFSDSENVSPGVGR